MTLAMTSAALGMVFCVGVLLLVRKGELHGRRAAGWLLLAVVGLVGALTPGLADWIGASLGVSYPPMLVALASIVALALKALAGDVGASRRERDLRRLSQRVALLELELFGSAPPQRDAKESAANGQRSGDGT